MSVLAVVHLILAVLVAFIAWLLLVLVAPTRRCPRCKGERVAVSYLTGRRGGCPRCRAQGRCYRRGATWVHRVKWLVVAELRSLAAERRDRKADS
jgi:hypothetical protein